MWSLSTRKAKTCTSQVETKCVYITKFELIYLYLFGPTQTKSLSKKKYIFVIVDYYSRFTWVTFLVHKDDTYEVFKRLSKEIYNEKRTQIGKIRSHRGSELLNVLFDEFCDEEGIQNQSLVTRTPQQNGC